MPKCSANQPCCSDPRQSCFGKRRDSFFCYNDERAQMCPSPWQPTNSRFIVYKNCGHADPNFAASDSQHDSGYPTSYQNRSEKKKTGEIKQLMNYLKNCVRQRYIIDWTDEDDEQLLECSYNKICALHSNKTEEVLNRVLEQAQREKDEDLVMFVEKIIQKYIRSQPSGRRSIENRRSNNANGINSAGRNYVSSSNCVEKVRSSSNINHKIEMGCKCKQCLKEAGRSRHHMMDDYGKGCSTCSKHAQAACGQHGQSNCGEHGHGSDECRPRSNSHCDPMPLRGGNDRIGHRPNQWFHEDRLNDSDVIVTPRRIAPADYDARALYESGHSHPRNHFVYTNQPGSIDTFFGPNHLYNLHRMRM